MGAFYLAFRDSHSASRCATARATFEKQGFSQIIDLSNGQFDLLYCRKINGLEDSLYRADPGNFCLTTGTLIYREQIGAEATKTLFEDFRDQKLQSDALFGNFAILIALAGTLRLFTDPQGVYNIWHDPNQRTFSSSFPALFEQTDNLSVNTDAVYQQVFQEATFGGLTLFNELHRVKVKQAWELTQTATIIAPLPAATAASRQADNLGAEYLETIHRKLGQQFSAIATCFGDNIDSALSGGYDSRLLLALLREQQVTPELHVYGKADSADVLVAKAVCEGEQIPLKHEDKSSHPRISEEEFVHIVEQNFYAFQGSCADGLLDNGSDLITRRSRTVGGRLQLNGGGGEVMRNFFYLPNRRYSARELLWTFFSRFDPAVCTPRFSENRYYEVLEAQILELTGVNADKLERATVESLYASFRCTYWMGQNNAINNQFGWFLTPFVDASITATAHHIPISEKDHGRFQAKLINAIDPRLAAYPSDYGHNFSEPPPLKRRLKGMATLARPPILRKYLYRLHKHSRENWPYYLQDSYVKSILPGGFVYMQNFFDLDKVNDAAQYRRICSIEYLLQHTQARMG